MNRVKKRLLFLATGEFAALCTFILLWLSLNLTSNLGMASRLAFSYLIFILLQGSLYWFYRYLLMIKKSRSGLKTVGFLRFLRGFNILVLIAINVSIPIVKSGNKDLIIALAAVLFGIIEYINYYWYRLSYGKSGFNIRMLLNTRLQESSINKLINRCPPPPGRQ